jgi:hypothetical protein
MKKSLTKPNKDLAMGIVALALISAVVIVFIKRRQYMNLP